MGNQRARSRGLRHGTRNMFTRGFRQNGPKNATTYLRTFRVSDTESAFCSRVVVFFSNFGRRNHRCRRECVRFSLESNRSRVLRACFEAFVERNGDISVRDGVLKTHFVQFSSTASTHYLWGFFPSEKKIARASARACDARRRVSSSCYR